MQFRVLALRADGSAQPILLDASDAAAARRQLARDGLTALELAPTGALGARLRHLSLDGVARTARFDVDLFCQEMLALVTAGVTVGEALETLASKEAHGSQGAAPGLLGQLHTRVREGLPLSSAMAQHPAHFPAVLCESLRAAERTSDYGPALERFVRYTRLTREVREKLLAASIYPLILLGVSTLVLLFLVGYVVPRFAGIYADMGDKLPLASRLLLWVGARIGAHPWLTGGALLTLVGSLVVAVRTGHLARVALMLLRRIPRLSEVLTAAELSRLYRTLAMLLHGGIPMVAALQIARGLLAPHLVRRLDAARTDIGEGRSFSDSMRERDLSTPVADRFFRVGEGSGKLAEMIDRAADFHEEEVARGADWLGRIVGPFLMLAMGIIIGLVVVLMYMPIFSLAEAIQ